MNGLERDGDLQGLPEVALRVRGHALEVEIPAPADDAGGGLREVDHQFLSWRDHVDAQGSTINKPPLQG